MYVYRNLSHERRNLKYTPCEVKGCNEEASKNVFWKKTKLSVDRKPALFCNYHYKKAHEESRLFLRAEYYIQPYEK